MATRQRFVKASTDGDHQVIPFRPRTSAAPPRGRDTTAARSPSSLQDEPGYERSREPDDYRHRMTMNVAAGIVTIVLTAFGIWLAMSIADLRKTTDCILVGRQDCATFPAHHRS